MRDITKIIPFGKQEPEISKVTKQLYIRVQYSNPLTKIVFKDFVKNIREHCKIQDFDWTYKEDNKKVYPSYNGKRGAKNWYKQYDYPGAYRVYAEYMNSENHNDLILSYGALKRYDITTLFTIAQTILDDIQEYQTDNKDGKYSYKLKALLESYKLVMDEIRERLGIKKEIKEHTGNLGIQSENLNLNIQPSEEVLEENEDTFERFIERRLKKAPETTS